MSGQQTLTPVSRYTKTSIAIVVTLLSGIVIPTDSLQAQALEEVVVTAQKREESIRDVPIAMQAFTAETLKQLGIVDTRDLANLIPGFSFANTGQDNPIYTLRGIGFNDTSRTANSSVGVYFDEVPIAYPYMTQGANVDLERIEVLKGPQGTLYGRNTTGGAINYIAQKPTRSLEFGLEAEYGRFETRSIEGYLSGPITEHLSGRIALRDIQADEGWQVSLTRPDDRLGKKDKQSGRATLEWLPIEPLRLNFTVDWWRDRSEPQAPQPIAIDPQNPDLEKEQIHPDVRNHPVERGGGCPLCRLGAGHTVDAKQRIFDAVAAGQLGLHRQPVTHAHRGLHRLRNGRCQPSAFGPVGPEHGADSALLQGHRPFSGATPGRQTS